MKLREKRYRDVTNSLTRTAAQRDACLANLVRYEARLKTLRRQAQRLEKAMANPPEPKAVPQPETPKMVVEPLPPALLKEYRETADDPPIPDFLQRTKDANRKDAEAAAAIRQEQADHKKTKAQVRIEKMKAKQRGDTKRMPLTGKAALAAINLGMLGPLP